MKTFISHSADQTEKIAAELAQQLRAGDCIALCGELGGGKTTFVRGLFSALKGDPQYFVTSPTFTLLHEYPTKKGPLYHFDLYRIESLKEFQNIDFEEYFGSKGICVVEWGNKIPDLKKLFTYEVMFEILGESERKINILSPVDI